MYFPLLVEYVPTPKLTPIVRLGNGLFPPKRVGFLLLPVLWSQVVQSWPIP